jgi:hypothetical protein
VQPFNEYIYLMNAANLYVAQMVNGLDADLQLLCERWLRLVTLARWSQDIADSGPCGPRVAQHSGDVSVANRQHELDEAIEVLAESVAARTSRLWTSMRAVEVGLEEMEASFDGTDPLKPVHRQRLSDVRHDLLELIECLEGFDLASSDGSRTKTCSNSCAGRCRQCATRWGSRTRLVGGGTTAAYSS